MGVFSKLASVITSISAGNGLNNYVVFDLETTGLSRYYSEIIQISAIKVANGKVVEKFDRYIKPKKPIPKEATEINHITNDMVKDAPSFKQTIDDFLAFAGKNVLLGYNISGFDLYLLNNRLYLECGKTFSADYIDVLKMARKLPGLGDYKLTTVAKYLGVSVEGAHNALCDCTMTNECYVKLLDKHIQSGVDYYTGSPIAFSTQLSESSCAINVLRSILSEIVEDGVIDDSEFNELTEWVRANEKLKGAYPFDNISNKLDGILKDGIVEKEELKDLTGYVEEWLDPVGHARHTRIETLQERHVVITGDFERGNKEEIEAYISSKGGIVDARTTKKTELVVVGALGSKAWVADNYGTKIKTALEYREKGQVIEIISEYDFFKETKKL